MREFCFTKIISLDSYANILPCFCAHHACPGPDLARTCMLLWVTHGVVSGIRAPPTPDQSWRDPHFVVGYWPGSCRLSAGRCWKVALICLANSRSRMHAMMMHASVHVGACEHACKHDAVSRPVTDELTRYKCKWAHAVRITT